MRLLIYTGKGGVGKTSIAAATGVHLSRQGQRVLVMSTDQAHSLGDAFGARLYREAGAVPGARNLEALEIDANHESRLAWGQLREYLKQILSGRANGGLAADEALSFPGMEELFSLLKILEVYEEGRYDTIIVDCAPTGETLALARYPERLSVLSEKLLPPVRRINQVFGSLISKKTTVPKPRDAVFAEFERLVKRLSRLQELLRDREQCSFRIVTTPERIVLEEARRCYTWMQVYDFGVDAVYMNRLLPEEALQGYFSAFRKPQEESLALFKESFPGQRLFALQLQEGEVRGVGMLEQAARELYAQEDPSRVFCNARAFRIEEDTGTRIFIARLPHAKSSEIAVRQDGADLSISLRNETRRFQLPERLCRRTMSGWDYVDGELRIRMDYT